MAPVFGSVVTGASMPVSMRRKASSAISMMSIRDIFGGRVQLPELPPVVVEVKTVASPLVTVVKLPSRRFKRKSLGFACAFATRTKTLTMVCLS